MCSRPRAGDPAVKQPSPVVQLASSVVIGTLSGTIGSAILLRCHVDLHGFDVLHATRAGAVGGAIMTLAAIIAIPILFGTLVCIFPMMLVTLMASFEWMQAKHEEDRHVLSRPIQLPPDVERGVGTDAAPGTGQ